MRVLAFGLHRPCLLLLPLLLAALEPAAQSTLDRELPVPYPVQPVNGYVFSRHAALTRGITFEWYPSFILPTHNPLGYELLVQGPGCLEPARHQIITGTASRSAVRVHSGVFGPGCLDFTRAGEYRWGVRALGDGDSQSSRSGFELRYAVFFIQEAGGDAPASSFDIHPDHAFNSADMLAFSRSWKRIPGDDGYHSTADITGPHGTPDQVVDNYDLLALLNPGQTAPRLLAPLESQIITAGDFQPPPGNGGLPFSWTAVPGAIGYLVEGRKRDFSGSYYPFFSFYVRQTGFVFVNNVGSYAVRDQNGAMTVGAYLWRVRPVFLHGLGKASREEFFAVVGEGPSPTPTATPRPDQLAIADLQIVRPEHDAQVLNADYAAGRTVFEWQPARLKDNQQLVSNVTYVLTAQGSKDGLTMVPIRIETTRTNLPSNIDLNGDGRPDFPEVPFGNAVLDWQVYAHAPRPGQPAEKIFSAQTPPRRIRIQPFYEGYPGDVNNDNFADALDVLYFVGNYETFVDGNYNPLTGGLTSISPAQREIRNRLNLSKRGTLDARWITKQDVLEMANLIRSDGKLAHPSLPTPRPLAPLTGATVATTDVTFRWQAVPHAVYYMFVLDSPTTLEEPRGRLMFVQSASSTQYAGQISIPGVYKWRVRAIGTQGSGSSFCDPQTFTFAVN